MTDGEAAAREAGYIEGRRRTAINQLSNALRELLGVDLPDDQLLIRASRLALERSEAIATLRMACADRGLPNDWPDDLHLSDIIEKRLLRELE